MKKVQLLTVTLIVFLLCGGIGATAETVDPATTIQELQTTNTTHKQKIDALSGKADNLQDENQGLKHRVDDLEGQMAAFAWWETTITDRQVTRTGWDGSPLPSLQWPDVPIVYAGGGSSDCLFVSFMSFDKRVRVFRKEVDEQGNEYYKLENYIFEFALPSSPTEERRVRVTIKITFTEDDIDWTTDDDDYTGLRMAVEFVSGDMYEWKQQLPNGFYAWQPLFHFNVKAWAPQGQKLEQ